MKRLSGFVPTAIFLCLVPLSFTSAQDKKSEQKIKVIINDGSGSKIEMDTVITDGQMKDSLKLKNGKVIFFGHPGDVKTFKSDGGSENIFVTVTSDDKDKGSDKKVKSMTIVSSDSVVISGSGEGNKVYVISDSKKHEGSSGVTYRIITREKSDGEGADGQTVFITEGKNGAREKGKTFSYVSSTSNNESSDSEEKTKYIIAKDGMVITIESNDEAKAKELIKEIKDKLGVKDNEREKSTPVKSEKNKKEKK